MIENQFYIFFFSTYLQYKFDQSVARFRYARPHVAFHDRHDGAGHEKRRRREEFPVKRIDFPAGVVLARRCHRRNRVVHVRAQRDQRYFLNDSDRAVGQAKRHFFF